MIALLDTHSFLWAMAHPAKLSAPMRALIADPAHEIHVSTVSLWEIALKYSLGKLDLGDSNPEELVPAALQMGLTLSPPSAEESASFHQLPKFAHKDPFDRMLIWQCLSRRWTFVTRDGGLAEYESLGLATLW